VDNRGLRFDFNHFAALTEKEIVALENFVDEAILENLCVRAQEMPFANIPAHCIAHFSEKYGEVVRVLSIGDISMELCGGCHVSSTGELGFFKVVKESAIAAGVRRIEAVAGKAAKCYVDRQGEILLELERQFSVKSDEIVAKIQQLQNSKNAIERRLRIILEKNNRKTFDEICSDALFEGGLKKIRGIFEIDSANDLRSLHRLASQEACDVVIFGGNLAEGAVIAISCSQNAVEKNYNASHIARKIAEKFNGRGGGSSNFGMINIGKKLEFFDLESLKF
jgi:alanyl-tRNA synthetase